MKSIVFDVDQLGDSFVEGIFLCAEHSECGKGSLAMSPPAGVDDASEIAID